MKEAIKTLIINTHSVLNSGDTGIALAEIQFLKKKFPSIEISLTSRTPMIDKNFYRALGIKVLPSLFPLPKISRYSNPKIDSIIKEFFELPSKINLLKEIKKADFVVSSGGGYFYSNRRLFPGPFFWQNFLHVKLVSKIRRPLIFFPQSFGPIKNSIGVRCLKSILKQDNVVKIFTREEFSFDFLKKILHQDKDEKIKKLDLCPDVAFYLNSPGYAVERRIKLNLPKPIVAMASRDWDYPNAKSAQEKKEKYFSSLIKIAESILFDWNGSIVIFPQARGPTLFENDRIISKKLREALEKKLPKKRIIYLNLRDDVSPFYIIDILSQCDLIIATRLHAAIFALLAGVPAISIGYQPKNIGTMKLFELEHFCVSIEDISADKVLTLIREIFYYHDDIRRKIGDILIRLKEQIEVKLNQALKDIYDVC